MQALGRTVAKTPARARRIHQIRTTRRVFASPHVGVAASRAYSDRAGPPSPPAPAPSPPSASTPASADASKTTLAQDVAKAAPSDGHGDFEDLAFPDLMQPDYIMDSAKVLNFPPSRGKGRKHRMKYGGKVVIRNSPSMFEAEQRARNELFKGEEDERPTSLSDAAEAQEEGEESMEALLRQEDEQENELDVGEDEEEIESTRLARDAYFALEERRTLHEYVVLSRRVVQQTEKGRRPRFAVLTVVGNGDGLVGYGEGKHEDGELATKMSFRQAYRNMDVVARFEKRTLFTPLRTKLGSTEVILRPRPVGFGLAVNPNIHKILTAAGVKDCGGKVWGSRTPINVIKATFRMLHAGNAPLSMGNGIGGPGRKMDRGSGSVPKTDVERARGRKLVDLKTF